MRLFTERPRTDLDSARHAESTYAYLDRSARPEIGAVREVWEQWFTRYPHRPSSNSSVEGLKKSLRGKLMARRDRQQREAFWELYLHESLVRAGCDVTVRPDTPDFDVRYGDFFFHVEATVRGQSEAEEAADNRLARFRDLLNALDIGPWFLDVNTSTTIDSDPPAALRRDIARWVGSLDVEEVRTHYAANKDWEGLPSQSFEVDGWEASVRAIPKRPDAPRREGPNAIGSWSHGGMVRIFNRERLSESLAAKARTIANLQSPIVLAILLDRDFGNDDQVEEALFGAEQVSFILDPKQRTIAGTRETRSNDGLWSNPARSGARIDAVLAGVRLDPFMIGRTAPTLWTNPWRRRSPLDVPSALPWRHVWVDDDRNVRWTEFPVPAQFFDLNAEWPKGS